MLQLAVRYRHSDFDPLVPRDLLHDEIQQRRETGYDVDDVVEQANDIDGNDRLAVLGLVDELANARRTESWPYVEPEGFEAIHASLGQLPQAQLPNPEELGDRIHAAWLGRIAGCNIGKPVEIGTHWTAAHIREYLLLANAYPLRDYFPVLDPMPDGFKLHGDWPHTTRGRVNGSARDDDIDYPILALHLLEKHGPTLRPHHVADAWTSLLPILQVFTAERAAYVNLTAGLTPPQVATFRNPYREWIGAQIRGDVFGYVYAGDPWTAASVAFQDASLSHTANGVYGEMWSAALVAAAFVSTDAAAAIDTSLQVIPPQSRLAEAIRDVIDMFNEGLQWQDAVDKITTNYGHYSWVHTVNNAALVVAGLLWGKGDYLTSVASTVMGGWDTDSNGATAGSVAGILAGTAGLPDHIIQPLHDTTRSALFGYDNSKISELAARTHALTLREASRSPVKG